MKIKNIILIGKLKFIHIYCSDNEKRILENKFDLNIYKPYSYKRGKIMSICVDNIDAVVREVLDELKDRVENIFNKNHNIKILEEFVMEKIIEPTCDDLKIELEREGIFNDLGPYKKGEKPQDKGINKFTEGLIDEVFVEKSKDIHKNAGGIGAITKACEIMSDKSICIKLPNAIVDQLKKMDGIKPTKIIIQNDAKGCIITDNDSDHNIFHCGNAQTSIKKIISKKREKGCKPDDFIGRWMPREYKEINGQQFTILNGIPVITSLIKHVWSCEHNTNKYKTEKISSYIIPNGIIVEEISDVIKAPKDDTEIRFDILKDLKLSNKYHYFIKLD
jgi:hypothetical protein